MNLIGTPAKRRLKYEDWGLIPFEEAWDRQKNKQKTIITAKRENLPKSNYFIFCDG